jgi:hypothetical protein
MFNQFKFHLIKLYSQTRTIKLTFVTVISLFLGFADVKDACCGLGMLNAQFLCTPISGVCSNRQDHIFWDQFHPTEAASRTIVDKLYNGPSKYTSPVNLEQLLAL